MQDSANANEAGASGSVSATAGSGPVQKPQPAGTLARAGEGGRSARLKPFPTIDLVRELLARLRSDPGPVASSSRDVMTAAHLNMELEARLDVHENSFGRRRLASTCWWLLHKHRDVMPNLAGASVLDVGCGGIHPLGLSLVFLALGAERAFGVDLDEIDDVSAATRAVARTAATMLTDPRSIILGHPITRAQILHNLSCLDLGKLNLGDPEGLDRNRIWFLRESVHALSLPSDSVDLMVSNVFLEHVPKLDAALAEMCRVTKPGGTHVHLIDLQDHRNYLDPNLHRLAFLSEPLGPDLVHGSNRERVSGLLRRFDAAGFDLLSTQVQDRIPVDVNLRETFVEPFRSMPTEELGVLRVWLALRKRA